MTGGGGPDVSLSVSLLESRGRACFGSLHPEQHVSGLRRDDGISEGPGS